MKKFILLLSTALFLTFGMNSCSKESTKRVASCQLCGVYVNDSTKFYNTDSSVIDGVTQYFIDNDSIKITVKQLSHKYSYSLSTSLDTLYIGNDINLIDISNNGFTKTELNSNGIGYVKVSTQYFIKTM